MRDRYFNKSLGKYLYHLHWDVNKCIFCTTGNTEPFSLHFFCFLFFSTKFSPSHFFAILGLSYVFTFLSIFRSSTTGLTFFSFALMQPRGFSPLSDSGFAVALVLGSSPEPCSNWDSPCEEQKNLQSHDAGGWINTQAVVERHEVWGLLSLCSFSLCFPPKSYSFSKVFPL